MADKLLIVMLNSDPSNASELSAPLSQAAVAVAMEYDVEVILTGKAGRLAIKSVAENIKLNDGGTKTVYDLIKEAHAAGVTFKVCSLAVELWGDQHISEINEIVGDAYLISEAMNVETVTFTY